MNDVSVLIPDWALYGIVVVWAVSLLLVLSLCMFAQLGDEDEQQSWRSVRPGELDPGSRVA